MMDGSSPLCSDPACTPVADSASCSGSASRRWCDAVPSVRSESSADPLASHSPRFHTPAVDDLGTTARVSSKSWAEPRVQTSSALALLSSQGLAARSAACVSSPTVAAAATPFARPKPYPFQKISNTPSPGPWSWVSPLSPVGKALDRPVRVPAS